MFTFFHTHCFGCGKGDLLTCLIDLHRESFHSNRRIVHAWMLGLMYTKFSDGDVDLNE